VGSLSSGDDGRQDDHRREEPTTFRERLRAKGNGLSSSVELDNTFTMEDSRKFGDRRQVGRGRQDRRSWRAWGRGSSTGRQNTWRDHRVAEESYLLPRRSGRHQRLQVARRCGHSSTISELERASSTAFIIVGVARLPPPSYPFTRARWSPSASRSVQTIRGSTPQWGWVVREGSGSGCPSRCARRPRKAWPCPAHSAVHLTFDDERVDEPAAIVDSEVLQQLHHARLPVHLDEGDVVPERVGVALRRVAVYAKSVVSIPGDGIGVVSEGRHSENLSFFETGPRDRSGRC